MKKLLSKININSNIPLDIAMEYIKVFEGCRLQGYQCPAGIWTIGYGNTNYLKNFKGRENKTTITQYTALTLLREDVGLFAKAVQEELHKHNIECNSKQIAALISFTYNVGIKAFKNSTLLKVIKANKNDFEKIKQQFLLWSHISKVVNNGLMNRRIAEYNLYSNQA
jgi:lysozyme